LTGYRSRLLVSAGAGYLSAVGLFDAARVLERIGGESRMDAAEGAFRLLSVEASNVIDALRRHSPSGKERHSLPSVA